MADYIYKPKRLPIYKIKGKLYYRDERLDEYRNIKNPSDVRKNVKLSDLQKPTKKDSIKAYGR